MSDTTFTRRINIYIDAGQAQAAQEQLFKRQEAITASIKKYTDAGKEIPAKLTKQLEDVTNALDRQNKKLSGEVSPSIRDLTGTVSKLRKELQGMSEEDPLFHLKKQQLQEAETGLNKVKSNLTSVSSGFKDMIANAKGVAMGVLFAGGVQAIAQTVASALSSLAKFRNEFESSVKNLSAITGATGADLDYLKNASIELASTGSRSATEYVEAMKLIGSAKPELLQDKEGLVEVTRAASLLAKASGLDLPEASKRLTDALNQYGAPASEAAKYVDILAAAAKYGAAEIPGITDALLEFGPVAKQSNVSMQESAAAIELLAEKGVKGAEAGTKLRNVLLAMSAVDSLPSAAIEKLKQYGVNTQVLSDKTLSLETRLKELSKISGDANAMMQVFDKQNVVAGTILLENIPRYAALEKSIHETGVASAQAATNTGTLSSAWGKLTNAFKTLSLGVGTDWLKGIVSGIADGVTWFGKMTGVIKSNVIALQDERAELLLNETRITSLNIGNENRTKLIQELQDKYPQFLSNLDAEKATNEEIAAAISKVNNSLLTKIALAQTQERMEDAAKDRSKAELSLADAQLKMEKEIAALHDENSGRTAGAIKYNKQALEGMTIQQQAAYLLTGTVKLQEVANVSLEDLAKANADFVKAQEKKNKSVDEYNKILEDQLKVEASLKQQLGINDDGTGSSSATDKPKGNGDKEKEDAAKTAEYIKKLREELHLDRLTDSARELEVIRQKYAKERAEAKGNKEALAIIDQLEALAIQDWSNKHVKTFEDVQKSKLDITKMTESQISDIIFTEEEKREMASAKFAASWKKAIESVQHEFTGIQSMVSGTLSFISTIFNGLDQKENQELARDKKRNDAKAAHYKHLLDTKKISQKTYDAAIHNMDKEADAKKAEIMRKQFERNKAIQIVQTIANTAAAVVAQLANPTPYVGIVLAALAAATGVAQIAVIAAQQPPSFGSGTANWRAGIGGDKHSAASGGNPIIDPKTGNVLGIVEEKEAFIPADSAEVNQAPINWMLNNRGKPLPNFNVTRSIENVQSYANGTYGFQQQWRTNNTAPPPINNVGFDNIDVIEMMDRHHKEQLDVLKQIKDKKLVFSKYDYDTFNERNDFAYQRTSIG